MKRISLVVLSSSTIFAITPAKTKAVTSMSAPAASAPAAFIEAAPATTSYTAPASYASTPAASEASVTESSSAPLAPIHDDLTFGNPALPSSIGSMMLTPSDFYEKRQAAFQWNGSGATSFNGTGLAVVDKFFAGFSANGAQGRIAGGYITPMFGAGFRMNLRKDGYVSDTAIPSATFTGAAASIKEQDSTLVPTSFGVFGSLPLAGLTAYGHLDWGTPDAYSSYKFAITGGDQTHSSRSDVLTIGAGAKSPAMGDNNLSWNVYLDLSYAATRDIGQSSDSTYPEYDIKQAGALGKTFSSEGFILALGVNENIEYWNGYGNEWAQYAGGHVFKQGADWGYEVGITPTISTILPVFEHWFLKGGTGITLKYDREDVLRGKSEQIYKSLQTVKPACLVGVRFERGRWAAEAQVANGFFSNGPYFVSGAGGAMFGSFAVTANFK